MRAILLLNISAVCLLGACSGVEPSISFNFVEKVDDKFVLTLTNRGRRAISFAGVSDEKGIVHPQGAVTECKTKDDPEWIMGDVKLGSWHSANLVRVEPNHSIRMIVDPSFVAPERYIGGQCRVVIDLVEEPKIVSVLFTPRTWNATQAAN